MAAPGWPAQGAAKWQGGHTATWAPLWGATCRFANKGEKRQLIVEFIPLFIRAISFYFLRVGLCPTRFSLLQVTWKHGRVRFHQDGLDRVDPSPRDHRSSTCVMFTLSDRDRNANQSPRGAPRSTRFSSRCDHGFIGRRAVNLPYDRGILNQMNHDRQVT